MGVVYFFIMSQITLETESNPLKSLINFTNKLPTNYTFHEQDRIYTILLMYAFLIVSYIYERYILSLIFKEKI